MTWQQKLGLRVWLRWVVSCAAFVALMWYTAPKQEDTKLLVLLGVCFVLAVIVGAMHAYVRVYNANERSSKTMPRGMGWK